MHPVFIIAALLLSLTIPFWFIVLLLFILKRRLSISFKVKSIYSISNISIIYINNYCSLYIYIQNIRISLTWFRLRFIISNSDFTFSFAKEKNDTDYPDSNDFSFDSVLNDDLSKVKNKFSTILQSIFNQKNKSGNKLLSFGELDNLNKIMLSRKFSLKDYVLSVILNLFDLYFNNITMHIQFKNTLYFHAI